MLVLEVEYLRGVAVATNTWDRAAPEWPPHPDRVFSALVDAWAARGKAEDEADALRWLADQGAPVVHAVAEAPARDPAPHYVPPNDMRVRGRAGSPPPTGKSLDRALAVLPMLRRNRQPRRFPAVVPDDPRVLFAWPGAGAAPERRAALARLAADVVSVGHSSSLVRAEVGGTLPDDAPPAWQPRAGGGRYLRVPEPGRLDSLEQGWQDQTPDGPPFRPPTAPVTAYAPPAEGEGDVTPASVFGADWWVFQDAGGSEPPALAAFPRVARVLRKALMAKAPDPPPPELSGHDTDGKPAADPHLTFLPLADVGWTWSRGRLMGVALALPRAVESERAHPARRALVQALANLMDDQGTFPLKLGGLGVWRLQRAGARPDRASLRAHRYTARARRWATVTPMLLDRHPKNKPGQTLGDTVARACENIGLPAPLHVAADRQAPVRGGPAGFDMDLADITPDKRRPLRHAVITFAAPVTGPVVLGAGRFRGLGLCLPADGTES